MYIKKVENNEIEAIDKYMNYNNKQILKEIMKSIYSYFTFIHDSFCIWFIYQKI